MKKLFVSLIIVLFAVCVVLPVQSSAADATVKFGNLTLFSGSYITDGTDIQSTPPESGGYAYFNNGVLELWGLTAENIGMISSSSDLTIDVKQNSVISTNAIRGISVSGNLKITGTGDLTVTCNDNLSSNSQTRAAIYADSIEIDLNGNMTFESKSEHDYTLKVAGIYAENDINIKNGYIHTTAGVPYGTGGVNAGIWANMGKTTISGGRVFAYGRVLNTVYNKSYGIYGSCEITGIAEDGKVEAQGMEAAFQSTVTFAEDFAYEYRYGYTGSWQTGGSLNRTQKYIVIKEHTCTAGNTWVQGEGTHWKECSCGNKAEEAAHTGGAATGLKKAKCTVCGKEYGDILSGDVNGDGVITRDDGKLVFDYCNGCEKLTAAQIAAADMDGNEKITVRDAMRIYEVANTPVA